MKRTVIGNDFYDDEFEVFVCTHAELLKALQLTTDDIPHSPTNHAKTITVSSAEGTCIVLWFNEKWTSKDPAGIGTLVHECLHTTTMFLKVRGFEPDAILDEAGAYFAGWLAREIVAWDQRTAKRKRRP